MILKTTILVITLTFVFIMLQVMIYSLRKSYRIDKFIFRLTLMSWLAIIGEIIAIGLAIWFFNYLIGLSFSAIESFELGVLVYWLLMFIRKKKGL